MDHIIRFVPKSELERERLIREARAIYDSIFPPVTAAGGQADDGPGPARQAHASRPAPSDQRPRAQDAARSGDHNPTNRSTLAASRSSATLSPLHTVRPFSKT